MTEKSIVPYCISNISLQELFTRYNININNKTKKDKNMEKIVSNVFGGVKIVTNVSALKELDENNCTMPNVKNVIYNIGKKAYPQRDPQTGEVIRDADGKVVPTPEVPVLATVVTFIDGTKVTVVNSQNDGVEFEDHVLSNGETVKVATKASKERGLVYAIMKRLCSRPDKDGKMADAGLGRILGQLVDNAYDTAVADREAKIQKARNKARLEAEKKNPKPKKVRYSINETLARFNKILDKIEGGDKELLEKVVACVKA